MHLCFTYPSKFYFLAYHQLASHLRSADDNSLTIYLGTAGGFPATPSGQDATAYREELITKDQATLSSNEATIGITWWWVIRTRRI